MLAADAPHLHQDRRRRHDGLATPSRAKDDLATEAYGTTTRPSKGVARAGLEERRWVGRPCWPPAGVSSWPVPTWRRTPRAREARARGLAGDRRHGAPSSCDRASWSRAALPRPSSCPRGEPRERRSRSRAWRSVAPSERSCPSGAREREVTPRCGAPDRLRDLLFVVAQAEGGCGRKALQQELCPPLHAVQQARKCRPTEIVLLDARRAGRSRGSGRGPPRS